MYMYIVRQTNMLEKNMKICDITSDIFYEPAVMILQFSRTVKGLYRYTMSRKNNILIRVWSAKFPGNFASLFVNVTQFPRTPFAAAYAMKNSICRSI